MPPTILGSATVRVNRRLAIRALGAAPLFVPATAVTEAAICQPARNRVETGIAYECARSPW